MGGRALGLVFVIGMAACLRCQTTGVIEGTIHDPSGASVPRAALGITETGTSARREVSSDADGRYQAPRLAPGTYEVTVSHPGFREQVRRGIQLEAGAAARVDFTLELGEMQDRLVVVAEASPVNVNPSAWGGSVKQQELEALPLMGRDLFELATQQPGVILVRQADRNVVHGPGLKVSVHGMRPNQNGFLLDGIQINDASRSVAASAAGVHLGVEGVRELRVISSPFSAEYGKAVGAVFTAVTKSGSNELHGSLYDFLRNSALDARNFFDDPGERMPPLRRDQFGGALGGPIRVNKLFYMVNYEATRETLSRTLRPSVPNEAARGGVLPAPGGGTRTVQVAPQVRPYLDLYPLPNGRDFGDGTAEFINESAESTREDYLAGKLDVLASPGVRLSGRYTFDSADREEPDPLHIWRFFTESRNQFFHTEAQHLVSPTTIHTFRTAFSRVRNAELGQPRNDIPAALSFVPGQPLGSIVVTGLADIGGQTARLRPRRHTLNHYQLNDELAQIRGRHSLRAGAGFSRVQFNQVAEFSSMGHYQFSSLGDLLAARPLTGDVLRPGSDMSRGWRQNELFAYFQDELRAGSSLSLSLGVRYEFASTPVEVHGKVATLGDPERDTAVKVGGDIFRQPRTPHLAPRVSLAWDPFGSGRTAVRAGAGIFYDLLSVRDVVVPGVRVPPFYDRVIATRPSFPDLAASIANLALPNTMEAMAYRVNQPYVGQFQCSIERQLDAHMVMRLGYAGSRGIHLLGVIGNINPTQPTVLPDGRVYFPPGVLRVNPAFATISWRATRFNSFYHSLSAGIERRMRGGLAFQGNYVWGKSLDETSNSFVTDYDVTDLLPTMYNFRQNRGPSEFDQRQVFNANLSYQVPRRGKSAAGRVLGDWEVHLLAKAATGTPFAPSVGFDRARLLATRGDLGQRPDFAGRPGDRIVLGDPAGYFDALAFSLPEAGLYGNLGRGTLTGPGLFALDAALHKVLWRNDRQSLRLRIEAFNATNHPNFSLPSGLALFDSSLQRLGSAGRITETSTSARQMQLAVKWVF